MNYLEDSKAEILKEVKADRIEVDLLGVTLYFSTGHSVMISASVAQNIQLLMHSVERKALDKVREDYRRAKGKLGFID